MTTFTREQPARDDTRLQSPVTLTFLIEPSDLKTRRFDRVIVDVTSL